MPKRGRYRTPPWKLIVFIKGKRYEKQVIDPKLGMLKVVKLNRIEGVKAHLVSKRRAFPIPTDDNLYLMQEGMIWCPYCRRWRFFKIPKYRPGPKTHREHEDNSLANQEVRCCPWCGVTEREFYVRVINGITDAPRRRRARRRRARRKVY